MAEKPDYPFDRLEYGKTLEVAAGIHWIRMPLPFALNHINLWLLADGDGWTVIDSGYNNDETRAYWETIFARLLDGKPIRRIIVSHFHPDHASLAGWFAERWGAPIWMTYSEWMQAQLNRYGGPTADIDARMAFYAENGMEKEGTDGYRQTRPDFSKIILPLPISFRRMMDGDFFPIDGLNWQVITGAGHSPEHAALWCKERNILISGDQILPRISTNVSLQCNEPDGDPLRLYLESLKKFSDVAADALVLPSHDSPFYGLHDRIDGLAEHHEERLEATYDACSEPLTARALIPYLFRRELDQHQLGFAIGEALAHANYLVIERRLTKQRDPDGMIRYRQAG
jgi:glyoxylase-like metal-dependent hydrolase (beta-lactamase superfamily II)